MHVKSISERLAKRHDVTVYEGASSYTSSPRYINGVKVEGFRAYSPSDAYNFSWEMLLKFRKVNFDVVHGHGYHAFPLHFSAYANCRKFVATTHFHGVGHSPFRKALVTLLKPFGKNTLERAEKIIAVSEYEKSLLCREFGFDGNKVMVIPNGVDFTEFSGLSKQTSEFKSMLYVGYLSSFKGVHYLVEILPKLTGDIILEIVGSGPLEPYLKSRSRALNVENRVRFYRNLPRNELLQKFANAGVFVILSRYEAYSLVVAEALAAGTPCIVAKTSAMTEWVDNQSVYGLDIPIDMTKFAALVNKVLDQGSDRQAIRKWMNVKILDWTDVAQQLENVYSS